MKPAPLQISHEEIRPDVVAVRLSGKLMLGPESAALEDLIIDLLKQGRRKFVIDLAGVTHIDSTGIGRFIASLGRVQESGGTLVMVAAGGFVRESFRIMRLDTVFHFYSDVETALKEM